MTDVFRHLLESTAFAVIAALIVFRCNNHRAVVRYRLWLLAALKFGIPASLFVSLGQWTHDAWSPNTAFPTSTWHQLNQNSLLPSAPFSMPVPNGTIGRALFFVWMLGLGLCLGAWLIGLRRPKSTTNAPASVIQMVTRLQRRMGLRRSIKVRSTAPGGELALSGIWSSVLLIPPGLEHSLTYSEWEAVLSHELIHAKRWDNLAAVIVHFLLCLFWFHPILWWIERRLIAERELACDEAVLAYGSCATEYVAGILKVCQFHLVGLQPGACGAASSDWKKRMTHIMSYTTNNPAQQGSNWMVNLVGAVMTVIPVALGFWQAPALYGHGNHQAKTSNTVQSRKAVSCLRDGKSYVEGTTIQQEGVEQLCVEALGKPVWVRTSSEMRKLSRAVVVLPKPPALLCEPRASASAKLCACQNGIYSPGAIVDSSQGALTCAAGKWRTSTRQELGYQ